jgi:hypothetical protein
LTEGIDSEDRSLRFNGSIDLIVIRLDSGGEQLGAAMSRWVIVFFCWCLFGAAQAQQLKFDPDDPLPGKKKPVLTGPRAIIPAVLSLTLASGSSFVAYKVIVEDSLLGKSLPKGSFLVGMMAVTYPSVGRLFVPENNTLRSAILFSTARVFTFALYYSSNLGVSSTGREVAQVAFLGLSALDIGLTARLRFPEEPGRISLTPALLPGERLGVGLGVSF